MSLKRDQVGECAREEHLRLKSVFGEGPNAGVHQCAWPGCHAEGEYKAPASRNQLRDYVWYCLEHIREFNRSWDYFDGMSEAEIEAHRRADTTWHRPSWRFGGTQAASDGGFRDPFGFFDDGGPAQQKPAEPGVDGKTRDMMRVLELNPGFAEADLRRQYKLMVKRHHPDLHGGARDAEEKLKQVNEAYAHLRMQFA